MKNDRKLEHELIVELESAYQKVYEMETLLKEHGHREGYETEHPATMIDLRESEIRYRRLFEAAQDGILILDAESGAITDANPFIREILGYSPQDLIGKRLWEIGAFFDVVASKAAFEELQQKEYIRYENLPLQTKDGQLREVEFISNVYLVDLKKVIQCNIRNITKRREAEKALRDSEICYRRLFESTKDGILIIDAETGKIIDVNPSLLEILNYSQKEMIGKELWEIGPFKYIIANQDTFRKLQGQEYVRYEDLLFQNKEGVTIHMEFISSSYFINERKVIQCNIRDITDRERAEQEIEILARFPSESPNPVLRVDQDGKINYANPASEALLRLWNRTIGNYLPPEWQEKVLNTVRHSTSTSVDVECEGRFYSIMVVPIPYGGYIYLYGSDITEHKQAVEALRVSEEKYRHLFDDAVEGVYQSTLEGKFINVNSAFAGMLGYESPEEVITTITNIACQLYVNPDERKKIIDILRKKRFIKGFETQMRKKDGSEIWASLNSRLNQTSEDDLFFEGFITDISERKRAEDALRRSEERYRRLVNFSPDAIMVHNGGKFVYVNPAAIKLLGAHNAAELLGKPVLDIVHPDYRESVSHRITTGIMENKVLPLMEEKILRLDGVVIDIEVAAIPIEYDGLPAMQDVVRDISEKKKLQQELLQSQKMQSIGTLAGGIAHDFNNILGIILGYISLIEKNKIDAQKKSESIAAINQAVQRGAALVRQILTFARKTDISLEPLSLADLVQELFSMLEQTFPEIITFKKILPKDIPIIRADRTQIHQALLNLCVNARDAMPNGGSIILKAEKQTREQLKEQFPTADQESYVCISVTDTGEGMNEATRCRVFDPFFTTKAQGKGTGLGLSVVHGVVQAHHGFINVESELGHGTTFRLYFPVPAISEKPIDFRKVKSFEIGGTETILLVEDEELLIKMVRFLLESKGYKVFVAQDGAEAIEVYKKHRQEIALVLTDMGLPLITGIEEFKKLKEIDLNVRIIFASGFFEPNVKSELLKAGVKGFLQKPYMPDEILRVLREVLDGK